MVKKLIGVYAIVFAMLLSACSQQTTSQSQNVGASDEKYSIVATAFHEYDWVMQILGEKADDFNVTLLMDAGVDVHSYEPNVEDISNITTADLFVFNGGQSHDWVFDLLEQPANEQLNSLSIMEVLGDAVQAEVMVEGMQASSHNHDHSEDEHDHSEDEHDHSEDEHDHAEDEHEHEEDEQGHDDEHVWLSLNNAIIACENIAQKIAELDHDNADTYLENAANYNQALADLHTEYETAIAEANRDTLIFADRFPFLYMMQDYNVNYYAAFQGCDAETEASTDTITFLAEKVTEFDVQNVLILDNGLEKLASTVISSSENTDAQTLALHSMQSVSAQDIESGATYHSIMSENLETIKQALA